MASFQKPITVSRNEEVTGEVVAILDKEIIVDLGIKSEGVLNKRDLSAAELKNLKVKDQLTAFVESESESGQIILSLVKKVKPTRGGFQNRGVNWDKFKALQKGKSKLKVNVLETNRGGLVVEHEGSRGFIPSSQIDSRLTSEKGLDGLVGQNLEVEVIEVDPDNNRLVFGQKTQVSEEQLTKLAENYQADEIFKGVVSTVSDSGVRVVLNDGTEGFVPASKLKDSSYLVGQETSFIVEGIDKTKARVNLAPMLTSTKGLIYK